MSKLQLNIELIITDFELIGKIVSEGTKRGIETESLILELLKERLEAPNKYDEQEDIKTLLIGFKTKDGESFNSWEVESYVVKYEEERIRSNIELYEEYCEIGKPFSESHISWVKKALESDFAQKRRITQKNRAYAIFLKDRYHTHTLQINGHCVGIKRYSNGDFIDYPLANPNLPQILEEHITRDLKSELT